MTHSLHDMRMKVWRLVLGWLLLIGGILVVPLPLPIGLLMFLGGLSILVVESKAVRHFVRYLRRKNRWLDKRLSQFTDKAPESLQAVLRQTDPELEE